LEVGSTFEIFCHRAFSFSGKCDPLAPRLPSGTIPECDPDSGIAHCCSSAGYYGTGETYCLCEGCIDFKANPDYEYKVAELPRSQTNV
jgi:hypothetical protein